jgi:hypothetical protein
MRCRPPRPPPAGCRTARNAEHARRFDHAPANEVQSTRPLAARSDLLSTRRETQRPIGRETRNARFARLHRPMGLQNCCKRSPLSRSANDCAPPVVLDEEESDGPEARCCELASSILVGEGSSEVLEVACGVLSLGARAATSQLRVRVSRTNPEPTRGDGRLVAATDAQDAGWPADQGIRAATGRSKPSIFCVAAVAPPRTHHTKNPAFAGLLKRLKGLEPSTFCMAIGMTVRQNLADLPANPLVLGAQHGARRPSDTRRFG